MLDDVDSATWTDLPGPQMLAVDQVLLRGENDAVTDQRAVAAAFLSVIERFAESGPVLLAIDDLQWLDPSSIHVLAFAARRLTGPVGILGSVRTEADEGASAAWLQLPRPKRSTCSPESIDCPRAARRGRRPVASILLAPGDGTHPRSVGETPSTQSSWLGHSTNVARCHCRVASPHLSEVVLSRLGSSIPMCTMRCSPRRAWRRRRWSWCRGRRSATTTGWSSCSKSPRARHYRDRRQPDPLCAPCSPGCLHRGRTREAPVDAPPARRDRRRARAARAASGPAAPVVMTSRSGARRGGGIGAARGAPAAAAELMDLAIGLGGDSPERRLRSALHHFDTGDHERAAAVLQETVDRLPQ